MINKTSFTILEITAQKIWNLKEIKNYLRISSDFDDQLLEHLLETSIKAAENFMGINLTYKKMRANIKNNYLSTIWLKYRPILEIQKIFTKNNELETLLTADDYSVDLENAKLHLLNTLKKDELIIEFTVGIDEKKLSPEIKQGILIHTCQMYERQDGVSPSAEVKNLYAPYRTIKV